VYIPPCVTPCANILKLFREREKDRRGVTRSFVGPALVGARLPFFSVLFIRIDGGRAKELDPLIFGPLTVSSWRAQLNIRKKKEKKKSEIFPISKDSGALLSRSTILTDM
jgi:hypothetical protein